MENQHYVGIDISKRTLDWAIFDGQKIVFCASTENSALGIKSALSQMREIPGFIPQKSIFCMEHTARRPQEYTMLTCWNLCTSLAFSSGWRIVCR